MYTNEITNNIFVLNKIFVKGLSTLPLSIIKFKPLLKFCNILILGGPNIKICGPGRAGKFGPVDTSTKQYEILYAMREHFQFAVVANYCSPASAPQPSNTETTTLLRALGGVTELACTTGFVSSTGAQPTLACTQNSSSSGTWVVGGGTCVCMQIEHSDNQFGFLDTSYPYSYNTQLVLVYAYEFA